MKRKILVSPRSLTREGHPALERLTEAGFEVCLTTAGVQPSEAELLERLPGCAGYLAGVETVSAAVLEAAAPELKVISRNGVGIDSIDLAAARRLGIEVRRTPGANARGVAELAVGLMFALARFIPFSDASLKQADWKRRKGLELQGRVLGLLGCGAIGKEVATMGCGLGMVVTACDPCEDAAFRPCGSFCYASLDMVLEGADVLSLHCPMPEGGRPLLDAAALDRMRPGVRIVNTARGALLDERAMLAALDSGHVAGLAMDVFRTEPPGDHPLVRHPNVIATPHVGGFTGESVDRAVQQAVDHLLDALA
jgi:phosphoglycerate dehydrogenase-like enzyme